MKFGQTEILLWICRSKTFSSKRPCMKTSPPDFRLSYGPLYYVVSNSVYVQNCRRWTVQHSASSILHCSCLVARFCLLLSSVKLDQFLFLFIISGVWNNEIGATSHSIVAILPVITTGKSLSEAFAEHGENMLCTKIVLNVRNNFCT